MMTILKPGIGRCRASCVEATISDCAVRHDAAQVNLMLNLRLSRDSHLKRAADFRDIHAHGTRVGDEHLLVVGRRSSLNRTRFGLSVSRRHGCAVDRNRKRRLLRESFRLVQPELPAGLDLVLIPRQRSDSRLCDFQASLRTLARRLDRRLPVLSGNTQTPLSGSSHAGRQAQNVPNDEQ
jgi:ribonuclease P protein component